MADAYLKVKDNNGTLSLIREEADGSFTDLKNAKSEPTYQWLLGRYISSSGIVGNDSKFAASTKIPVQPGDRIRSTINGTHSGKTIWFVWYRGDTFVSRETAGSPDEKTVPQTADTLRFSIATSDTMTQAIADDFQFDFYSKDLSYQKDLAANNNLYNYNSTDILEGKTALINDKADSSFNIVANGDGSFTFWGTASRTFNFNLVNASSALPDYIEAGKTYYFENMSENIYLAIFPMKDGESITGASLFVKSGKMPITIPENCNGILIRLQITEGTYTSETVYVHGYNCQSNKELTKRAINKRYSEMISFGNQPASDGSAGSFCNALAGTYAQLLSAVYEPIRSANPNYVSRKSIGKDASNTYDIYAYTFEPRYYQQSILLVAGIHAIEEDAIACLARFAQLLVDDNAPDDFRFIRQNIKVTMVPVVNVWGYSQSPHTALNADGEQIQQFNATTLIAEDAAIVSLVNELKEELSFVVDMHTTTSDNYRDFYGIINRYCPNVRTLFRVNAWLCDHYALEGRTVDDQYFGYRTTMHTFNYFCWGTKKVPSATLELSDYHWGTKGSSDVITMGVTMWGNYIIQQINDCYNSVDVIPFADYREVSG